MRLEDHFRYLNAEQARLHRNRKKLWLVAIILLVLVWIVIWIK